MPGHFDMPAALPASAPAQAGPARLAAPVRLAASPDVTSAPAGNAGLELLGRAGMVAVRVADLAWPAGRGPETGGRSALTAAGAGKIRGGDLVVFCKPVAIAPAVVRRDGRVQAAGHPAAPAWGWPRTGWMPWPGSPMSSARSPGRRS